MSIQPQIKTIFDDCVRSALNIPAAQEINQDTKVDLLDTDTILILVSGDMYELTNQYHFCSGDITDDEIGDEISLSRLLQLVDERKYAMRPWVD